jgi:hypothetical protein
MRSIFLQSSDHVITKFFPPFINISSSIEYQHQHEISHQQSASAVSISISIKHSASALSISIQHQFSSAIQHQHSASISGEFTLRFLTHQLVFFNATKLLEDLSFCSVRRETHCYFSCTPDHFSTCLNESRQRTSSLSVSPLVHSVSIAVNIKVLHSWTA